MVSCNSGLSYDYNISVQIQGAFTDFILSNDMRDGAWININFGQNVKIYYSHGCRGSSSVKWKEW